MLGEQQRSMWIPSTHKQLEMRECVISTVATNAMVLKHQAVRIYNTDQMSTALDQFRKTIKFVANNITKRNWI